MSIAWPQVDRFNNKDPLNADVLNTPVDQLASRTDYLKRKLSETLVLGESLILKDVDLVAEKNQTFSLGDVVYRGDNGFYKAQAKMSLCDNFKAADSAFATGVLVEIHPGGEQGDVLIYGKLEGDNYSSLDVSKMLQQGETFRPGRYYVSAIEAGKITAAPNGPLIYIGSFFDNANSGTGIAGYINPQFLDLGTSHVHRAYSLVARPAGEINAQNPSEVIGHLPEEYTADKTFVYPSLIFGGTWTGSKETTYNFTLTATGDLPYTAMTLQCGKNGSTSFKNVNIPAFDVFVSLDNGLKVKIHLPTLAEDDTRTIKLDGVKWNLNFPTAGRGWVNHSVDALATSLTATSSEEGVITPELKAYFYGAWPKQDNKVFCYFPTSVSSLTFTTDVPSSPFNIGGVTYQFVAAGGEVSDGITPIQNAGTISASLFNLARQLNTQANTAEVFVSGDTLILCNKAITGTELPTAQSYGGKSFEVFNGKIPLMVVYDSDYSLVGSIIHNTATYTPIELSQNLKVIIFADGATKSSPCVCTLETRLYAEAYDFVPGAKYDYVMGLHEEVDYYFPPVPAQSAGLFVNGVEVGNSALLPFNATYTIGRNTIHWLEDDENHRPWPAEFTSLSQPIDPSFDKAMAFHFTVGFQCATGPVTSITPAPGAPIKIYTYGTNDAAYTGDLMIDAALNLQVSDAGVSGFKVVKEGQNGNLLAGPVVEKIKAGSGILISEAAGCPEGQGVVTVSLENGTTRGYFNEVALENAKQEKLGLFPYISLLGWGGTSSIPSAFTMMMRVPTNLDPERDYQLQLRLVMFGATGYQSKNKQLAGVQLEYNILPDYTKDVYSSLKTGLLMAPPRQLAIPLGHLENGQWEYISCDPFVATTEKDPEMPIDDVKVPLYSGNRSLPIPDSTELGEVKLKPGYLVALRLSRITPPNTGVGTSYRAYTGPLGFLSMEWTLEEV